MQFTKSTFGISTHEAWKRGICICCKEDWRNNTYTELGEKEYRISALCEYCFDILTIFDENKE